MYAPYFFFSCFGSFFKNTLTLSTTIWLLIFIKILKETITLLKKWHSIESFKNVITKKHSYSTATFLRLFRFKFFKSWIRRKFSFAENPTSNSNTGKVGLDMIRAVTMKTIGWNVMVVAIKLTGRILCCSTNENAKDRKLDTFVMFASKNSIARQIFWDIETHTHTHTKDPYKWLFSKNASVQTISKLIKKVALQKVHFVKKEIIYLWAMWKRNQDLNENKDVCFTSSVDFNKSALFQVSFEPTSSRCVLIGFLRNNSSTVTRNFSLSGFWKQL